MRQGPIKAWVCAALAIPALANPPFETFDSFNDWLNAVPRGVRIEADGTLRLGPSARRVAQIPEGVVWAAVSDGAGGLFLSAGNEGRLFRYAGSDVKPLAQVKGGMVFAMARLGQDLIVAPSGENKLFRVTSAGDVKPFADIDARQVWAMAVQGSEVFVAGSNERGAVFLMAREGSSRKLAELGEESAFSALVPDPKGGWFLGTHGHGLVARHDRDQLSVLAGTGFEQVQSLVAHEGALYVAVNNGLADRLTSGSLEKREVYASVSGSGTKGAVLRLDRNLVPETLWQSARSQVFALAAWNGQLLLGTGNRSRVFSIPLDDKARAWDAFAVLQDLGTAQATSLIPSGSDLLAVASNPAEVHLLSQSQATDGTLESQVLRGNPVADWGRLYIEADAPSGTQVEFQCRVGSTEWPDGAWTPWTPPLRSGERLNLPSSRYAQFRLKLSGRGSLTPVVNGVRMHWANRNLPPVWERVDVMPSGLVLTRSGAEDTGLERVPLEVQKLVPSLGHSGSEKKAFRRGAQAFLFQVSDPNGDELRFSMRLLPESGAPIPLAQDRDERFFTFDTLPVPDGRYRLEVEASDAPTQPFNLARTAFWRTAAFTIDHTPPAIPELSAVADGDSIRVTFVARDERSVLAQAMVSADGDQWLQVAPDDHVFDGRDERFEILVPRDRIRGDRVTVRVIDGSYNEQAASVTVGAIKKR